jgi:predicted nucleotidyltransferase
MISEQAIQEVVQRLVKLYDPKIIYLFGSYAWGHPDEDSDLDFLIIVDEVKDRYKALVAGYAELMGLSIPKDLLMVTSEEFESRSQNATQFLYKIKHKGKQVYARA